MQRFLLGAAVGAALISGCATPFRERRTPSGEFCSDMHVVPAGQVPDREYHRLQPIASDPEARTEAERLESLRKAACAVGADAVVEAVNEEVRAEDGRYVNVASGTAVLWIRPTGGFSKPLTVHPATKPAEPEPPTTSAPAEPPPASEEAYEEAAPEPEPPAPPGKPTKPGQSPKPGQAPASPTTKPSAPTAPPQAKPSSPTPPPPPTTKPLPKK